MRPGESESGTDHARPIIAEPRFLAKPSVIRTPSPSPKAASAAAPFVVDPNDLDKLAGAPRKRVDANPALQQRVAGEWLS